MKFIDFFSGVGGFRRGLELEGHECVGFCEFDKFAVASYTSMHLITEKQRAYLSELPLKQRQKEILKEEYRNGEWYANDIRTVHGSDLPRADCWCAGFPCQDISIAGKQLGFDGNRSSLYFQIIRLLEELPKENRPKWIFLENVKNLLSVNGGWDFARVLFALDGGGYDVEWGLLNSKDFGVPQNRERVFIIGHLRGSGGEEIFPVEGTDGKDCIQQIGNFMATKTRENPNQGRIYAAAGIAPCLNKMDGGGREPSIALPVLTPDRATKRQNGRRFKEDGEPMFTLTGQDRHGVAVSPVVIDDTYGFDGVRVYKNEVPTLRSGRQGIKIAESAQKEFSIWNEKYQCYIAIRKLTPKECFRLQGWTDDYFEKAAFVNSNSQLYKQAGNGVTVNVIQAIAKKFCGNS